jgi:ketosteroid isomerase-like protein
MKILAALTFTLALFATPALAGDVAADTAEAVRQADLAFARRSQEVGFARAFLEFMDESDSLTYGFDGPPVKGAQAIFEALGGDGPSAMTVEWAPTQAWGSRGGDMGVTVGDYRRIPRDASRPALTGRYVTVWRRNAQGQWKGLIDIGEADPAPAPPPAPAAN